ncbi:retrovirus-related pol polyprotein from transposon TNT 1-94 [Tanacetum coccineum]|uniref:Retrovirus-related pol polyprotein from transposon TNT 1-94 n=1 Tax=Tanacetum coccineum TaxID=301880 RepID=A0ABQ5EKF7_9ASTR
MYDGDLIHSNKLVIHLTDSEETLKDAEESRNKMRHKMVQIDYEKLNALYDTFVPQQEPSTEQTYFSIPSTSDNGSTSKDVPSESPGPKMPNESRLLKMIDTLGDTIFGFQTRINKTFLQDTKRRWMSDSQNELREFYKTDVIPMSRSLYKTLSEIKEELIEEVQEMLNIFESMEQKVNGKSPTEIPLQNEIDRLLEVSLTSEIRDCVLLSVEQQKHELLKVELEKSASDSRDIQANLLKRIKILENDFQRSQAQSIEFELELQHQKEKMACDVSWKAKLSTLHDENVLLKQQVESTVQERENIKLEFQKLLNSIKATGLSIKMKLMKCLKMSLKRHMLMLMKSNVKRALFTSLVAAKSKGLGATSVVAKSRFSVAKTLAATNKVIQLVLWIVDSGCSKHMTGNLQMLRNFVEKFMGTVRFGNDHFTAITGYGDYNLEDDDLLTSSRDSNLYTISISEMAASSPVCLMSRATSTKSWLWHRRLSHLNFGTINQLTLHDLVDGLLKFKYNKNHLCSACEQGKSKKASLPPKLVPSTYSKLELRHMDLCGPMRVASINGKKYILVIIDDYSRYTWVYFLRTKDEAPDMIIDFVNQVQQNLKASILTIQTDNGTKFKNEKLRAFYAKLGILSRGFRIYNRRTKKIMETIHVKFDELTAMASECNNLEPGMNCANFNDSLEDSQSVPSTLDLDNLFGPMYEEYYATRSQEDDAPQIVFSSEEQVVTEPNSIVLNEVADEFVQEDVVDFDGNMFHNAPPTPEFDVAESSSTYQDPSNMHQFHQQHRSIDIWTKNHPLEQVIGSGYQQKDKKPSQNDKTEHGMEKMCYKSMAKDQKMSNLLSKRVPELKFTIGCNLYPSDGPGKPNSISMKTVKTKWALNQLQQPICVQLTKTVKTLKARS